jgi:sulfonate transport system ATP-binding protein
MALCGLASIGFNFQEPRLFPWLTVAQNIGFALSRCGAHDPRVAQLLVEVGLDGELHILPSSQGQF